MSSHPLPSLAFAVLGGTWRRGRGATERYSIGVALDVPGRGRAFPNTRCLDDQGTGWGRTCVTMCVQQPHQQPPTVMLI